MKKILFVIVMLIVLFACTKKNEYTISISVDNAPDSILVISSGQSLNDSILIVDGKCEFSAILDTIPQLAILRFPFPSHRSSIILLESGHINVEYTKKKGFIIGGTPNNKKLQELNNELAPYSKRVIEKNKKWKDAYLRENRDKQECEQKFAAYEEARMLKTEKQKELIKKNPNYAGFVISLPLVRYETATNLKIFLDEFKEFSSDPKYLDMKKKYKNALKTTDGANMPAFTYPDPEGNMVSLSDFKGNWVLIMYWYANCHWCLKMAPDLLNIYNDWKDEKNFEIIGVSIDKPKNKKKWIQTIDDEKLKWTQVWDSAEKCSQVHGVNAYPTMFLVDPEGKGTIKILGYRDEASLRKILKKQMN